MKIKQFLFGSSEESMVDFPFYNDKPVRISLIRWLIWFLGTVLVYMGFTGQLSPSSGNPSTKETIEIMSKYKVLFSVGSILMVTIIVGILLLFAWVGTDKHLRAIFKKLNKNEVIFGISVGIITLLLTIGWSQFLIHGFHLHTAGNSEMATQNAGNFGVWLALMISDFIEIIGEELLVISSFLFLLWLCTRVFRLERKMGLILSWLVSSVIFALMHMSSYGDQLLQVLLIQGMSRMLLTIPYLKYKNLWASYTTHVTYDLITFVLSYAPILMHRL